MTYPIKMLPPPLVGHVHHMDALELMRLIPVGLVDAIITDLPYGTTACHWDEIIPFAPMWAGVKRILKPRGVFVTTASQPFTSKLVMSNLDWFKYEWVWDKPNGTNFLNAPFQPLKTHENILVFSAAVGSFSQSEPMMYFPQMVMGVPYKWNSQKSGGFQYNSAPDYEAIDNPGIRYPRSIINFGLDRGLHPTQKPVALYEYLIRTYTQPGDLIVDFACGSGTTAVAAQRLNRRWIIGDSEAKYVEVARKRLALPYTVNMFEKLPEFVNGGESNGLPKR